jgi:hypothetical protein
MKQLAAVLFAVLVVCRVFAADPTAKETMMRVREGSLEGLKGQIAEPGAAVVYEGHWKEWHRFYVSISRIEGSYSVGGHGQFRCKDIKLVSTTGEAVSDDAPCLARVTSVDLSRRIVVVDLEGAREALRRALEDTEKELSNKRPEGTPGKSPSSNPSQVPGAPHP